MQVACTPPCSTCTSPAPSLHHLHRLCTPAPQQASCPALFAPHTSAITQLFYASITNGFTDNNYDGASMCYHGRSGASDAHTAYAERRSSVSRAVSSQFPQRIEKASRLPEKGRRCMLGRGIEHRCFLPRPVESVSSSPPFRTICAAVPNAASLGPAGSAA